jgi:predicted transcriptional regulator
MVTKAYSIRLDDDVIRRLDRIVEAMKQELGIARMAATRTDALRMVTMMGLEEAEATFAISAAKRLKKKR